MRNESFCSHDVYIALWEWYFDTILIERIIDALQHIADHIRFLHGISPNKEIEIDT